MIGFVQKLKNSLSDASTIKQLCELAEMHSRKMGQPKPGAEHYVLAALELPDQQAANALKEKGVDPESFSRAIFTHYEKALNSQGIELGNALHETSALADTVPAGLYDSQASGQQLMQKLAKLPKASKLNSLHVLQALSQLPDSMAMQILHSFHISPEALHSLT